MSSASNPPFAEFVALIALVMGITALGIDNILPAFVPIREDFGVAAENQLQLLVYAYMLGFAPMQLVYGPLTDMIGRTPVLMTGLAVFAAGSLLAALAPSFELLLVARIVQGMGAAGARVLATAIIRDRFEGREMARVMSLTMMVFVIVPVIAPATGSLILAVGSWHAIFIFMLLSAALLAAWAGLRLPETLPPENRLPFAMSGIIHGIRLTATTRVAIGYSTALGLLFGCILAYVGSAQQIFETEIYALGPLFPVVFGLVAAAMGIAALVNSSLVRRHGMRRMSHGGLCGSLLVSALLLAAGFAYEGRPPLVLFALLLACHLFLLSLAFPNFNAMAMEPLGGIAGIASAFMGFHTTVLGALSGLVIGQAFDGTIVPLAAGFLGLTGLSLAIVLWTEKGRLFKPQQPAVPVGLAGRAAS